MALQGTNTNIIYENQPLVGGKQQVRLGIYWERTNYSVLNNTSTILVRVRQVNSNIKTTWGDCTYTLSMTQVGTRQGTVNLNMDADSEKILLEQTFTINHNTSGSALALNFTFGVMVQGLDNNKTQVSHSTTLSALPDYPTLSGPSTFSDEEYPTITYLVDINSVSYLIKLEACIADGITGTTIYVPYQVIDNTATTATTYTYSLSSSERTAMRNAAGDSNSVKVRFYLKATYSNGEVVLVSKPSTMYIESAAPRLDPVVANVDEITLDLTGNSETIVRGYNTVSFRSNAVARKGATITSQSTVCGSKRSTSSYGTFSNVESGTFIFTATDNRGNSASATVELDVIPYVKVSCRQEVELGNDGVLTLKVSGSYYDGSFGAVSNTLKIEVQKTNPDGSIDDWADLTPLLYTTDGNTYELEYTVSGLDPSGTYTFQSRVSDRLTTAISDKKSATWHPIFDWGRNDFNFNVPVSIQGGTCYGVHLLYSGSADGNVVLYDEIDNYDFIDIYFTDNNGRGCGVSRLFGVNGGTKTIDLSLVEASSATATYIRRTAYICKDRTLSPNKDTAGYVHIGGTAVSHNTGTNYIRIIRVLGYK